MIPAPAYRVTVQHLVTRVVHSSLEFSLAWAEAVLAAYQSRGWDGEIEEVHPHAG